LRIWEDTDERKAYSRKRAKRRMREVEKREIMEN
jgi:hypothetical protein